MGAGRWDRGISSRPASPANQQWLGWAGCPAPPPYAMPAKPNIPTAPGPPPLAGSCHCCRFPLPPAAAWHAAQRTWVRPRRAAPVRHHGVSLGPQLQPPAAKHLPVDHQAPVPLVIFQLHRQGRAGEGRRQGGDDVLAAALADAPAAPSFHQLPPEMPAHAHRRQRLSSTTRHQTCNTYIPAPHSSNHAHARTRVGRLGVPSRSTMNSSVSINAMKPCNLPHRVRQRSYSATWGPCVPALGGTAGGAGSSRCRGRGSGGCGGWAAAGFECAARQRQSRAFVFHLAAHPCRHTRSAPAPPAQSL